MSATISPTELTQEEAERVRACVKAHGAAAAARMFDIYNRNTLERAIARTGSSRLTITVIRARLSSRTL